MAKKVLVRAPNWIGDAVMATPALSALRRSLRSAEIVLLAKPVVSALFESHPDIDRVIVYEDPGTHSGVIGLFRLSRRLRSEYFDIGFLLQNALEAALLTTMAGIPERVGYVTDGRGLFLTRGLKKKEAPPHRTDAYLSLVSLVEERPDGGPVEWGKKRNPFLVVTASERESVRLFLQSFGLSLSRPLIGINPGAAYGTAKRWLPERFAEVADRLAEQFQAEILIFGGKAEIAVAQNIKNQMRSHAVLLTGKTTVRQMMAAITQCRLFITNDSGPMHVASALGVPQVAIFGPTNPTATSSIGKADVVVRRKADCAPCRNRVCPTDHRCMTGISADAVFEAAKQQMNGSKERVGAVFLDRDGTINHDTGYIDSIERFSLIPGAAVAIARLNRAGMPVILVTNQSGVARGLFSETFLERLHCHLQRLLAREGAYLDGIYCCPHHPDYMTCACRKPAGGLIKQALSEHPVDLSKSVVVGDKCSDLLLAKALPDQGEAKSILVQTGEGVATLNAITASGNDANPISPDHVSKDLSGAVDWILGQK